MIVAGPEGLVKNQYRKFNIKSADLTPGDDYAMMREVLTRRFRRLVLDEAEAPASLPVIPDGAMRAEREQGSDPGPGGGSDSVHEVPDSLGATTSASGMTGVPASRIEEPQPPPIDRRGGSALAFGVLRADAGVRPSGSDTFAAPDEDDSDPAAEEFPNRPDLVLIDGGLGQLGVARQVLEELGIRDIALIGVAKGPDRDAGREHFHIPGRERPGMLEPRDPVLYFVQRLRDEAHRFAIGSHRAKRSKGIGANPLDEIPGIGQGRKRALLKHFGSAKAVSRAGVDDLKAVDGISAQMAQTIYDFFHERSA
jgi:excinuclease ABC subunit C